MNTVNLIVGDARLGLTEDVRILCEAWTAAGYDVTVTAERRGVLRRWLQPVRLRTRMFWQRLRGDDVRGRFDYNVMLERLQPEYFPLGRCNVLVPNPEWFGSDDLLSLPGVDLVLAKTRYAESIFMALRCTTRYLGFTSPDRADPAVARQGAFLHVAGQSPHRGTQALLDLWLRNADWPKLTVVQHPHSAQQRIVAPNIDHRCAGLPERKLRALQNGHLFHLCPSETEGFAHPLVEALSVGAVSITVDAPPMNEIVAAERGLLVPYARAAAHGLATRYYFSRKAMTACLEDAMGLGEASCRAIGLLARSWYEANDAAFRERARSILE